MFKILDSATICHNIFPPLLLLGSNPTFTCYSCTPALSSSPCHLPFMCFLLSPLTSSRPLPFVLLLPVCWSASWFMFHSLHTWTERLWDCQQIKSNNPRKKKHVCACTDFSKPSCFVSLHVVKKGNRGMKEAGTGCEHLYQWNVYSRKQPKSDIWLFSDP